jgi:hypothetical protein
LNIGSTGIRAGSAGNCSVAHNQPDLICGGYKKLLHENIVTCKFNESPRGTVWECLRILVHVYPLEENLSFTSLWEKTLFHPHPLMEESPRNRRSGPIAISRRKPKACSSSHPPTNTLSETDASHAYFRSRSCPYPAP